MNFITITNNIIDISVILNVSIGVVFGISAAHLLSDFVRYCINKFFPYLYTHAINFFSPLQLSIEILGNDFKHVSDGVLFMPKIYNSGSFVVYINIAVKTRWPRTYNNHQSTVIVNVETELSWATVNKQLIDKNLYRIEEFTISVDRPWQTSFRINPRGSWNNFKDTNFKIQTIFQKKVYTKQFMLKRESN